MFDGIMCGSNPVRLVLRGALEPLAVREMLDGLEALIHHETADVVIDLAAVSHLDGTAIGAFGFLFRRLVAQGRRLLVEGASGQPLRLLQELGIAAILGIAPAPPRRAAAAHAGWALAR